MEDVILQINYALSINKRVNPNSYDSTLFVRREDDSVYLESLNGSVSICLGMDELRAIMRLFDVAKDDPER